MLNIQMVGFLKLGWKSGAPKTLAFDTIYGSNDDDIGGTGMTWETSILSKTK